MRRILEILRLKHGQGLSLRQISHATRVGVTTELPHPPPSNQVPHAHADATGRCHRTR